MRKRTITLILLWLISIVGIITVSTMVVTNIISDFPITQNGIVNQVEELASFTRDQFDNSKKTVISDEINKIDINVDDKLELIGTTSENIYVKEYHTNSKVEVKNGVLSISNDESTQNNFGKIKLYVPTSKINNITINSTADINIKDIDLDQLNVTIMGGNISFSNSKIKTLSGEILDGAVQKTNTEIQNDNLSIVTE